MYLKNLKLAGFKSFVDPTTIPVRSNMNAVVGPNGCGKSNIVDAIRWVVGETSAKQLRGQSMTDVIFNGTTTRKPVGKALVELTFDNQDGRAGGQYAGYSELAIRRELQRDGQSSYFINGTLCRRRDIIGIFLGTGLGPRSYSVIEQGMISQLIESKPEEFRVYLEEAAGISKYKERRRETENRIKRTQENLDRLNDLCEELEKQLRHLKRQANAAERYKHFKDEERLLHAQIKGLQWQVLAEQLSTFDERLNTATLRHEEQLSNQSHLETDIEKTRLEQTEASDHLNEVQKRFYALGAEIARIEQRIKDKQEQTQRWKNELEEAEALWEELTESSAEHQDQIQEVSAELAELSPQADTIQSIAEAAQKALHEAEANMNTWQEQWEAFQENNAASTRQAEVARNSIAHCQQQIETLTQRQERIAQNTDPAQLEALQSELNPIEQGANELASQLEEVQATLDRYGDQIREQRQQNSELNTAFNHLRRELQADEARHASLLALQEEALSGDQQANAFLEAHNLTSAARLGTTLKVNNGWELAVETVLGGYFDAVCVDDVAAFADQMNLDQGNLTLIDRHSSQSVSGNLGASTLAAQVESDWPIATWLSSVYIADSVSEAMSLRDRLSSHESVITREGLWFGANWVRKAKPADSQSGVLAREQELSSLSNRISQKQTEVDSQQQRVEAAENRLAELETEREQQHKRYQSISAELTQAKSQLGAKRSRYEELQQQQARLQKEMQYAQEQAEQSRATLAEAEQQLAHSSEELSGQEQRRSTLVDQRDRCREALQSARETAQREQQKADELEIRLSSNQSQLALLKQTIARAERQMQQLGERREHLMSQLADNDNPMDSLNTELQQELGKRRDVEQELHAAEEKLETTNQQLRHFETKRGQIQQEIDEIKEQLQTVQMERQALTVRQTTIQEQLTEQELELKTILEQMPEEANMSEWEERAEAIAKKISRLGPINLAAIEEYDQVSERKIYLDKQQADLNEALEVLQEAIRKIDRETRTKFRETYDKVKEGFQTLFPKVFGGGSASLELEEDDLLTSGVIVKAQPPGKRNSTIHMLSGGEKALTAISLVFSLFQLNPAPFCVLDEVDAPLDDVNVGRFCKLVKEMSESIQFIVISHNKVTIEMADHLMGVTMQEPGASRLVSVDMEEAISMAG